jgi:c-di-GMP-related signal transduction protein
LNTNVIALRDISSTEGAALENIFLARQPIVDRQQRLVAYELLFRSCDMDRADITQPMRATTTVEHNAFNGTGIAAVLDHAHGYINVDAHFLLSDFKLIHNLDARSMMLRS